MEAERKMAADTNGELRELIDEWAIAVRAKDIESVMSQYLSDVVAFDVVDPLEYKGTDMLRQRLTDWFSSFEGPLSFDLHELHVTAGESTAFCHYLALIVGPRPDGRTSGYWARGTTCFERRDGEWLVTHEHISMPSG